MKAGSWLWIAKALAAAGVLGAAVLGVRGCQEHCREQGRAEVRQQWSHANDKARADAERAARTDEQRMARQAGEKEREQLQRETVLRDRARAAERAADGLRAANDRLTAASHARRAAGTCAAAEREADEAATARGLLGACAGRYSAMAARTGELASQVIGLQDYIVVVQPETQALLANDEGRGRCAVTIVEDWLTGASLLQMLLLVLMLVWRSDQRDRLQKVEKNLQQADECLVQLRVAVERIEAQLESALKETNASRAAVRRVEDYLMQSKRSSHEDI